MSPRLSLTSTGKLTLHLGGSQQAFTHTCSPRIHGLVAPLESQLDESIACAIWFAARAEGIRYAPADKRVHLTAYVGIARVHLHA